MWKCNCHWKVGPFMGDQITRVPPTGFDACKMVLFLGPSAFHYGVAQQKGHRQMQDP